MLRIGMIAKYPPIEGGVSSSAYWLARGLGRKGVEVHVITNAYEVEAEWRENLEGEDLRFLQPENVIVHNTDPFALPRHTPLSKAFAERLASVAIEVTKRFDLDVVDCWYLLPYGVSGVLCKSATQKPLIVRHAGSDIMRLYDCPDLMPLLNWVLRSADMVITSQAMIAKLKSYGVPERNLVVGPTVVDAEAFSPSARKFDLKRYHPSYDDSESVVTFIGKCEETKGILDLLLAARQIEEKGYKLLIVTGGRDIQDLRKHIDEYGLSDRVILMEFLPPWKIPGIIRASTCVVAPERDFPLSIHTPIIPREVLACGSCLMLSTELHSKRPYTMLKDEENALIIDPHDINGFAKKLARVIADPNWATSIGERGHVLSEELENFDGYVNDNIGHYVALQEVVS